VGDDRAGAHTGDERGLADEGRVAADDLERLRDQLS
jgi:hypothetical protein